MSEKGPLPLALACLLAVLGTHVGERASAGEGRYLEAGETRLGIEPGAHAEHGVALYVRRQAGADRLFIQERPVEIVLVESGGARRRLSAGYQEVTATADTIVCRGELAAGEGQRFLFTDTYAVLGSAFLLRRQVSVDAPARTDRGFMSRFGLHGVGSGGIREHEYFIPAIWYRNNAHYPQWALANDYGDDFFFIREDRMPLPLVMMRATADGATLTLVHRGADASTFSGDRSSHAGLIIDERVRVAALGVHDNSRPTSAILFPGSEGERTYSDPPKPGRSWALRAHPVRTGVRHAYDVVIRPGTTRNFPQAMHRAWCDAYDLYNPPMYKVDLDKVYKDSIDLLSTYWQETGGVPGFPFNVRLPGGGPEHVTYQSGFIGQQIPLAGHMIKHGLENGLPDMVRKGEAIVDFWARHSLSLSGLPRTWYDPEPRRWRPYLTFPRIAADGLTGMLRAWHVMRQHGRRRKRWLGCCRRFGDWLIANQNGDGSYHRQYDFRSPKSPPVKGQESKLASTHPIQFLVELHLATGDTRYLDAARRAGEFSFIHIHGPCAYVGGVPDNPDVPDSHGCAIAMQAFLALHDATGESRWLEAALQAARFSATWTYAWNVARYADADKHDLPRDRSTAGLSTIAVGHSAVDMWMSLYAFDYYRLHLLSGENNLADVARLLVWNTKQTIDWDGSLGYRHPGLQTEVMDIRGYSKKIWLPWLTFTTIEPMALFKSVFGTWNIDEVEKLPLTRRKELERRFARDRGYRR